MALNDYEGELVLVGWFLYDGTVPTRVEIIARNYDVDYHLNAVDDVLESRARPASLGLDGRLYYLKGNLEPHPTLEALQAWADRQPWGPVDWHVREPPVADPAPACVARDLEVDAVPALNLSADASLFAAQRSLGHEP